MRRLSDKGARVISKERLKDSNRSVDSTYEPSEDYYIVFDLLNEDETPEFENLTWDFKRMREDGLLRRGRLSAEPATISLANLMKYVVKEKCD